MPTDRPLYHLEMHRILKPHKFNFEKSLIWMRRYNIVHFALLSWAAARPPPSVKSRYLVCYGFAKCTFASKMFNQYFVLRYGRMLCNSTCRMMKLSSVIESFFGQVEVCGFFVGPAALVCIGKDLQDIRVTAISMIAAWMELRLRWRPFDSYPLSGNEVTFVVAVLIITVPSNQQSTRNMFRVFVSCRPLISPLASSGPGPFVWKKRN